jgi:enoyl-CoA hydratase
VPIRWEQHDEFGVATIDRPERRNALNAELCEDLLARLRSRPTLRAFVITGSGDKAFCAGADLARRASDTGGLEHGGGDTFRPAFDDLLDQIVAYPAPVLAAVNGAALGAGMQLAVACDLRIVAQHATFGIPAARLGVVLSASNIGRLVAAVGQPAARDILFTARTLNVDEAERVGLVQRRADDALAEARDLCDELVRLAPISLAAHKRALNLVREVAALTPTMRAEVADLEESAFRSGDLQEGLAAFAEKRPPDFRGA